jgi:hypothetical protein
LYPGDYEEVVAATESLKAIQVVNRVNMDTYIPVPEYFKLKLNTGTRAT